MKLIDEMRNCLPPYVDIKRVRDWADRIERSGALVPVPDGDACGYGNWLENQASTAFIRNGKVNIHVVVNRYQSANGGPSCHIDADTTVQPVRLVKIAEAEI